MGRSKGWKKTQDTISNTKYGKNQIKVWRYQREGSIQYKRVLVSTMYDVKSKNIRSVAVDITLFTGKVQMPSVQRSFDTKKKAFDYVIEYMRSHPNG